MLDPRLRSGALARPGPVTEVAPDRRRRQNTAEGASLAIQKLETGFRAGKEISPQFETSRCM